jgi:hypothetical protein
MKGCLMLLVGSGGRCARSRIAACATLSSDIAITSRLSDKMRIELQRVKSGYNDFAK